MSQINSRIQSSNKSNHSKLVKEFNKLKKYPFNKNQIAKIKKLEVQRGNTAMVAFLESREEALKRGEM